MEWMELSKIARIEIGKTPARKKLEYWNGEYTWISIADMKEKYIVESKEKISELSLKETNIKIVPKGTVIMSFKLSIGKRGITRKDLYTNEAIAAFHIKDDKILSSEFLYYALGFVDLLQYTDRAAMGKTLNKAKLKIIKIPVPPIAIQKQIVEILDKAQKLVDNRKKQIQLLDSLIESIFYDMFGDPVLNDRGWEVEKLSKSCILKSFDMRNDFEEDDLVWLINLDEIQSNTGKLLKRKKVKFSKLPSSIISFNENYLLYSKLRPYLNKLILPDREGYGTSELVPILPKEYINRIYLFNLLKSDSALKFLEANVSGAKMPRVVMKDFRNLKIPIPPIHLQNQFAEKVELIESQKELMEESLKLMEDNYNSLMQRAFKGELF